MVHPRCKPGARPGVIRSLPEGVCHFIRKRHGPAFRDLEERSKAFDQIQADHGDGHLIFRDKTGRIAASAEVPVICRSPGGRLEHLLLILLGHIPPSLGFMLALLIHCLTAEIKRGSAGVDQVNEAVRILRMAFDLISGHSLHGFSAPVGAHVREHRAAAGQLFLEQHAQAVQAVILRGKHIRFSCPFIVKGRGEQCLREVAVGPVVGPLSLSLESAYDRIVSDRLFRELLGQSFVASHQILDDDVHLHREFPLLVLGPAVLPDPFRILVKVFPAVFLRPLQGSLILFLIVDPFLHAAEDFHFIDRLYSHAQITLEEVLIHDGAADSHGDRSDLQIAHAPQGRDGNRRSRKPKQHLLHILRHRLVIRFLHVPAVDAERGKTFLRMGRKDGCQVDGTGPLCRIQSPDTFNGHGVHVHRLRAIAPAGGDRERDVHAFFLKLLCALGALSHASDSGVRDHDPDRRAVRIKNIFLKQLLRAFCHGHSLLFQRASHIQGSLAPVNNGTDPDHRMTSDQFSCFCHI